jgi:PAS domain S-box-containing protein
VTVVGEAVVSKLNFLGPLSIALLVAFVLDAAVTSWRRGGSSDRLRAALVGGGICVSLVLATLYGQLVIWQLLHIPFLITPSFLVALLAMSFDLSGEMLHASKLAGQVREGQRRLEMAATAANLGLWEWHGKSRQLWSTRLAREIFGLDDKEIGDYQKWLRRVHADDAERLVNEIKAALGSGEEYSTEFRIRADGEGPRWIMIRGRAERIGADGIAEVRGVMRDVSESRRASEETHQLRLELAHAGRVSMLGQISSSLAHELSQPLGAILLNAEAAGMILRSGSPDLEELKAIVTDIQRDDRRARDVIDRLRTMLKRKAVGAQAVQADSLVQDVMALVRADAATRRITLEQATSANLPMVSGDRVQLSQVLLNLILNAMDAVDEQPAERRKVIVATGQTSDAQIEFRVTDTGPGIPEDVVRRIFEPFFTTKSGGMGIGLAISRTIAEEHGGSLSADGGGGSGATFRFRLPVATEGVT